MANERVARRAQPDVHWRELLVLAQQVPLHTLLPRSLTAHPSVHASILHSKARDYQITMVQGLFIYK